MIDGDLLWLCSNGLNVRRVQSDLQFFTNPSSYDGPGNKAAILCCCYDGEVVV